MRLRTIERTLASQSTGASADRRKGRRVLILGAPFGGGHMQMAANLKSHLEAVTSRDVDIQIADLASLLTLFGLRLDGILSALYRFSLNLWSGWPYSIIFRLSNMFPGLVARFVAGVFQRQVKRTVLDREPSLVISTYHVSTFVLSRALADTGVPVIGVVTDSGHVHKLWWQGTPDKLIVTHPSVLDEAQKYDKADRTLNLGLIIAPSLIETDRRAARRRLGLDSRLTILLTPGYVGYGPNLLAFSAALPVMDNVSFLIASRGNKKLEAQLVGNLKTHHATVVTSMTDALAACDLVIGKAGWLSLTEAMSIGRPTIVLDVIPGQEDENVAIAETMHAAKRMQVDEAIVTVQRYQGDHAALKREFSDVKWMYNSDLGRQLYNEIENLLTSQTPSSPIERDAVRQSAS